MTKEKKVKHIGCCTRAETYKPNRIRSKPFKWINFPIFIAIWFLLFWFIVCPISWSVAEKYSKKWPKNWMYIFWTVSLLVFITILSILLCIWKCCSSKKFKHYDEIFTNPEVNDEKENLCIHCMSFHPPGGGKCPCMNKNNESCPNCGNQKETFGGCCQKKKEIENKMQKGPTYDITLQRQQPDLLNIDEVKIRENLMKRNSLHNAKNRSSMSGVMISAHEVVHKNNTFNRRDDHEVTGIKMIKNIDSGESVDVTDVPLKIKTKKPNLAPIDVDLANRSSSVEFFGEKIPLKVTKTTTTVVEKTTTTVVKKSGEGEDVEPRTVSVGSMESMNKEKFNKFLHLVEINTPITPKETTVDGTPMSPREIFFRDLLVPGDSCESGSPDTPYFDGNKLEKKRPTSYILTVSDVKFEDEKDNAKKLAEKRHTMGNLKVEIPKRLSPKPDETLESPRVLALRQSISFHTKADNDDDDEKEIIRRDTPENSRNTMVEIVRKSTSSSTSPRPLTVSEQNQIKEFMNLTRESISKHSPRSLKRSISKRSKKSEENLKDDDVFN